MRTNNPFEALIVGLYSATLSVLSLNPGEAFALQGWRVATALAMVAWVVLAMVALWLWKKTLLAGLRWLNDWSIDYQISLHERKPEPVYWGYYT